jgi:hypothetical protein
MGSSIAIIASSPALSSIGNHLSTAANVKDAAKTVATAWGEIEVILHGIMCV